MQLTRAERFWAKVDKSAVNGCWMWIGSCASHGYGMFWYPEGGRKRAHMAHRVSWALAHGQLPPEDREICHSCDVPLCVNPNHLWVGTHRENMLDMVKKARKHTPDQRGENNHAAKLTEAAVREIRNNWGIIRADDLAERFGVNRALVYLVANRQIWKHVA